MKIRNVLKRLSWYNVRKGVSYLKKYGPKDFAIRVSERFVDQEVDYDKWFREGEPNEEEQEKQRSKQWAYAPLISIAVPVYQTPEVFLRQMIESVITQTYANWELCIADGSGEDKGPEQIILEYAKEDIRIRYQRLTENKGIAGNTNAAFAMCKGEYTALLDHDDLLTLDALYEVALAITKNHSPDIIYTDEDKVSADVSEYFQPHFKPNFSIDLLRSNNYICHFLVIKTALLKEVGGEDETFAGAQDYDLILRLSEKARGIWRVAKVLYHWRVHEHSTADNPLGKDYALVAGQRAIEAHLARCGETGNVTMTQYRGFYRVEYAVTDEPFVSIIIPNKDQAKMLKACLDSIRNQSTYTNYEIIVVENNSIEEETLAFYQEIDGKDSVRVVYWEKEFNYSAINNFGVSHANGAYILLLNNDITVITPNWIERLLANCQRREVGIVGARLYFPDNRIQNAGLVLGMGGSAGSLFVGMKRERTGYMHKAMLQQNLSAVTAACLMVKRTIFEEVGGLDEKLAVAFNDVDFCLRVRAAGFLVVYNPDVELYHHESVSRGYEDTQEKKERFEREKKYLNQQHTQMVLEGDMYYNPNLSLETCNYEIAARVVK